MKEHDASSTFLECCSSLDMTVLNLCSLVMRATLDFSLSVNFSLLLLRIHRAFLHIQNESKLLNQKISHGRKKALSPLPQISSNLSVFPLTIFLLTKYFYPLPN